MTEDQLVELLGVLLLNLHYIHKVRAELIFPSMTQYELLQNVFGNLRDFHRLKVNGCVEYETIENVLPQFQLMAERVGHFCFVLLSYQLDKTDENDNNELEVSQVNSMLVHLLLKIIPVSLEVMHICCTNLKASKSEEVGRFIKQLIEAAPDILIEYLIHLQEHMVNVTFKNLKSLELHCVEFSEWQVDAEKSFPVIEMLDISTCNKLKYIPDSFGDIASLKFINVLYSPQLRESTLIIKEYVEEMTGEDKLEVFFFG